MSTTPQMGLVLPVPGPNSAVPDWGGLLNTAFNLIDTHDHTAGHGVPVPSAGLNVNADLPFNGFNLTQARTLRLQQQAAAPALAADAGALYVTTAGDLWYNNSAGQHVQLTSGAALSAASLGGISGLGGTSAGVAFNDATKTFTFTQGATQAALLDAGPLVIRDTAASAFGITLQSPVGIAGAFAITLPTALPASNALLSLGTNGVLSAFGTVSGNDLSLAGNIFLVGPNAGISPSIKATGPGLGVNIQGNLAAGSVDADLLFSTTATRVAGLLAAFQNPAGNNKLFVDYQGLLRLASQAAPLQPASIWTTLTPDASWGAIVGFRYWKDANGVVRVFGQVTSTTGSTALVATLPAGFRPSVSRFFTCHQGNIGTTVSVNSSGQIILAAAPGGVFNYHFDEISFLAEA